MRMTFRCDPRLQKHLPRPGPARSQLPDWLRKMPAKAHSDIHGREIRTVEGLAGPEGALSPLQAAFRRHHALQCGFCTAGILMSLDAYLAMTPDPSENDLKEVVGGHLCRCTGYAPIIAAALEAAAALRQESPHV